MAEQRPYRLFRRRRLDVPEVHRLLAAQARLLNDWAEAEPGDRAKMWMELHRAGDTLADAVYGGPSARTRLSYWLRPYWHRTDSRVWRWQRKRCQYVVVGPSGNDPHEPRPAAGSPHICAVCDSDIRTAHNDQEQAR